MKKTTTARLHRTFEIVWLAVMAISTIEMYASWGTSWTRFLAFAAFFVLGVFRYIYSRKMRMRIQNESR
ncbi:hypothetical protein [Phaeocystidibacter luteus]|uniref:Uncharacterized protein n=1 Tax=Phaeocystidibacter luteus TaxID=911197 RepID=A0A6N6RKQ1_9FLAO|nr:hypothetical protein [Phaeocystidibacter luteus]KAB2808160.1 hypothetical protein F8C67_11365 [Phaeocystidibacter luteus]